MKKELAFLALLSAVSFTIGACEEQHSALNQAPGKYEKTVSTTDSNGTTVVHQTSTDVTEDDYGDKTAVIKSKTTKDPRGLFNKTTTESTEVIQDNQ